MRAPRRLPVFASLVVLVLATLSPVARADETGWLSDANTLDALQALIGKAPEDCFKSQPGLMFCTWLLTKQDRSWEALAEAIDTRYTIAVACELPHDGGDRQPGSCRGWGRKRASFSSALDRGLRILESGEFEKLDELQEEASEPTRARALLDRARSIRSLSFILGENPYVCLHRSAKHQLCRWRLGNRSIGYEIAASMIDTGAVVTLSCTVQYDGTPIDLGSCDFRER